MLAQIITENGQKKIIPLTADAGAGAPVGTIIPMYKKSSPSGYLYCDGSTFDETAYPLLYAYLGSNVLPDYREFALVGAEQNTTDTIATHDVYAQGEGKDDQLQDHKHNLYVNQLQLKQLPNSSASLSNQLRAFSGSGSGDDISIKDIVDARYGTVTRGKRKAVYFYIKATSGLSENAQDNVINTLNEERSYSTEEVNTGKKWIDGKPIYRKVVVDDTPTNNEVIATNVDNLISLGGFLLWANTAKYYLPWLTASGYYVGCKNENNSVYLQLNNTGSYVNKVWVILEYTKTTD